MAILVFDFSIVKGVGFSDRQLLPANRNEHLVCKTDGFTTTESDDSDGATRWSGKGANTFFSKFFSAS